MAQRIIYGNINADGTRYSGTTEFDSRKTAKGTYHITFRPKFLGVPTVVLTQNYPGWTEFADSGGNTKDNAVLIAVDESGCKYETGGSGGDRSDRNCGFIAIGDGSGPSLDD